jgi:hypothetical protein
MVVDNSAELLYSDMLCILEQLASARDLLAGYFEVREENDNPTAVHNFGLKALSAE